MMLIRLYDLIQYASAKRTQTLNMNLICSIVEDQLKLIQMIFKAGNVVKKGSAEIDEYNKYLADFVKKWPRLLICQNEEKVLRYSLFSLICLDLKKKIQIRINYS
jgi:hypothetical protein